MEITTHGICNAFEGVGTHIRAVRCLQVPLQDYFPKYVATQKRLAETVEAPKEPPPTAPVAA